MLRNIKNKARQEDSFVLFVELLVESFVVLDVLELLLELLELLLELALFELLSVELLLEPVLELVLELFELLFKFISTTANTEEQFSNSINKIAKTTIILKYFDICVPPNEKILHNNTKN